MVSKLLNNCGLLIKKISLNFSGRLYIYALILCKAYSYKTNNFKAVVQ